MDAPQVDTVSVVFDSGHTVTVTAKSRDVLAAEADGIDFQTISPIRAGYLAAYYGLRRMKRQGLLPEGLDLPETAEEFMDLADIEQVTDEGEGSGQAATTG